MILFVARAENRRPELAKRLRARRQMLTEIVTSISKHEGKNFENPGWVAAILLALEDGFRLHRLIDPETTPPDSFLRALNDLEHAIGDVRRKITLPGASSPRRRIPGEACQIAIADSDAGNADGEGRGMVR